MDDSYKAIQKVFELGFMRFLDEVRPKGKMCLSNAECLDISRAFDAQDWGKLERYLNKYSQGKK